MSGRLVESFDLRSRLDDFWSPRTSLEMMVKITGASSAKSFRACKLQMHDL